MAPRKEFKASMAEKRGSVDTTTDSLVLHQFQLYMRVAKRKPLLTSWLVFAKSHVEDYETKWKNVMFGVEAVKHGGDSIMLRGYFSAAGLGRLVKVESKMNSTKYTEIQEDNLQVLQENCDLGPDLLLIRVKKALLNPLYFNSIKQKM